MHAIFEIALPIFAVITTGFVAGKFGIIQDSDSTALNRFVFNIAMPVALFGLTSRTDPLQLSDAHYVGVYLVSSFTILFGSYFIGRRFFSLPKPDAGIHAFTSTLGNAVFLGLPIAQGIAGWGRPFVVLMLAEGLVLITIASILIAARVDDGANDLKTSLSEIILRPLKNPLVMGALTGFIYGIIGAPMPVPFASFLDILGRAAGPTALFSLGLFLSFNTINKQMLTSAPVIQATVFKLMLLPLMMFIGLTVMGIEDEQVWGAAMLFTLVPAGIGAYIQASARGRYVPETATAIAVTTVLSVLSVNGVLYFFA